MEKPFNLLLIKLTKLFSTKISSFFHFGKGSNPKTPDTLPEILRLGPNTEGSVNNPNKHYIDYIKEVLSKPKIYNIGLIGDYASGKSTIIENFLDDNKGKKVIRLSLAKIELNPDKTNKENETNTIKEKILELLFWQAKVAVPNSILQSVYKPSKILHGFSAFLFSLVFAFIAFNKINLDIVLLGNYTKISFYIVLLGCFLLIFWQLINFFIFLKNLGFSKINLKAPNVDLEISKNPFYKHLAQIIFILEEIAKKDYVVIVEDLDRFNEIEIFTALREISLIINYRLKNKRLPFLYALNSGLFAPANYSKPDNQDKDPRKATRDYCEFLDNQNKNPQKSVNDICKFFDVIIPVLKFSNNHTAKEEMLELITKEKTINSAEKDELEKVLEILCKNAVVDKRIGNNICEQYRFIKRLKFGDNFIESLKFSDKIDANKARAKLLAMTIFSIFDPQEYNALNNAKGAVWQLLENILTYNKVCTSNDEFKKFFTNCTNSNNTNEAFTDTVNKIINNKYDLTFEKLSLNYYDEDIRLLIDNYWKYKHPFDEEKFNKFFDKLFQDELEGAERLKAIIKEFIYKSMGKNLKEINISDVSKELIKEKYIEKQDYKDYLSRDPFQKDKVDSLAK